MKIQHLIIIRKLLLLLRDEHPNERLREIDASYERLLEKEELLTIIHQMTGGTRHEDDPYFEWLTTDELLKWIKNEYYILDFIIKLLEKEIGIDI